MSHLLVRLLNEIPKDYKPQNCKECRIRKAYARGIDFHFDYHDCIYKCDVKIWEVEE